jgi:hypothetical protein
MNKRETQANPKKPLGYLETQKKKGEQNEQ